MKDILCVVSQELKEEMKYYQHLDNILFTNIMIYGHIHGPSTIRELRELGMFNDFETFVTMAGKISGHFKRYPICKDETKQRLCEIQCLTGYLQNDPPGWDFEKEFVSLAEGGYEHGLVGEDWPARFKELNDKVMTRQPMPDFISFEDFIRDGLWITAGSSSIGKVEWTKTDDKGKFKARKNMLTELYTDEDLIEIVNNWDGILRSRVFTKDELSKRRLAVASNIEAYLSEAWILHLFGHGFKNYEYITLDESPKRQHERTSKLINLLRNGSFCLPFDFKGFDHQPQIKAEVQVILQKIVDHVRTKVPKDKLATFNSIAVRMVESYAKGEIINPMTMEVLIQIGGIPSGVRPTSLIGNVWNGDMTTYARELTKLMMRRDEIEEIGIKGDDTYIASKNPVALIIFRLAYAAVNAIGLDSKFGISQNICEFLRNEISINGCQGWSNRAIPSLSQRKPWNAQPWSPSSEVATVANNIYLLERRLKRSTPQLHQANKIKWSKYTNQSYHWLHLPVRLGGFGLYPFEGWEPNGKLPLVAKPFITVNNLKISREYVPWAKLTPEQNILYAQEDFNSKIATDDIPGPQKYYSRDFVNILRTKTFSWTKEPTIIRIFPPKVQRPPVAEHVWWPRDRFVNQKSLDPTMPIFAEFIRQHQTLKRASGRMNIKVEPLPALAKKWYPHLWSSVEYFEANGWHRTDAINLAIGNIPTEPTKILHPSLTAFVKESVKRNNFRYWKGRRNIALNLYTITTLAVHEIQATGGKHLYAY
ncbi:RNA-dependent RNA polymerase [Artivirus sani]|uniref:RNA-directed RNA polymerase n=1 Tax=Armigeres subalbatus virus SaX06-AK20 TaxID=556524 RepID=D2CSN2_9VIRU|nr:RNA-dependent RNA polymerase [Armigeres subalbatus virus SaX06-AK20]ACH85916.1 RNA-dependent RNA polymerase [Armigeres subalbatus virus SaX06-AK20]